MADWPPFSPNLNPLDFETRHVLQAKAQATPHSNLTALRPSIAAEFERKAVVCIHNTSDFAGERVNADIYQELLRQLVVPWVQRDVAWRNSGFWWIGRYFRRILFRWTSQPAAFCGQKARLRLTLIWWPYVHSSLRIRPASGGIDQQNMPLFPPPPLSRR